LSSSRSNDGPEESTLTRIALTFTLSGETQQEDLLREFALHDGVVAHASGSADQPLLTVQTNDIHAAIWDVRATVGIFDEGAVEVPVSTVDE
jgi:hypothetical protein